METNKQITRSVLVKCWKPEYYDAADHAIVTLSEDLILMLDKRLAQAKALNESDFYGITWWDYSPFFLACGGPETVGSDMSEEDFDAALEANYFVQLPESFTEESVGEAIAPMRPVTLTVTANGFYWTGTDKYIGAEGRVETYEMAASTVDDWAELVGCTEMLAKVRRCSDEGNS